MCFFDFMEKSWLNVSIVPVWIYSPLLDFTQLSVFFVGLVVECGFDFVTYAFIRAGAQPYVKSFLLSSGVVLLDS